MKIISVRENPDYKNKAIEYFQQSWPTVLPEIYQNCISHSINARDIYLPNILGTTKNTALNILVKDIIPGGKNPGSMKLSCEKKLFQCNKLFVVIIAFKDLLDVIHRFLAAYITIFYKRFVEILRLTQSKKHFLNLARPDISI